MDIINKIYLELHAYIITGEKELMMLTLAGDWIHVDRTYFFELLNHIKESATVEVRYFKNGSFAAQNRLGREALAISEGLETLVILYYY